MDISTQVVFVAPAALTESDECVEALHQLVVAGMLPGLHGALAAHGLYAADVPVEEEDEFGGAPPPVDATGADLDEVAAQRAELIKVLHSQVCVCVCVYARECVLCTLPPLEKGRNHREAEPFRLSGVKGLHHGAS